MDASYFPRYGCRFCTDTHGSKEALNQHLDEFIPEIAEFKKTRLRPATTHHINLIRAVRRRARRHGPNRQIRLAESIFDACRRWKLYVVIETDAQLAAFQTRAVHSRREWRALAEAYIARRAVAAASREEDDTESDAGNDTYEPVWPPAPAPGPIAMTQVVATTGGSSEVSQHALGSPVAGVVAVRGEGNSVRTPVRKRVFSREPLFRSENYGDDGPAEAGPSRRANPAVIDLTASPTLAKRIPPRRFDKPSPAHPRTAPPPAPPTGPTLLVKGLGHFAIPAFITLTEMLATVQARVMELMGPDAGRVAGLTLPAGDVDEAMWNARCRAGRMTVAVVWAWSS